MIMSSSNFTNYIKKYKVHFNYYRCGIYGNSITIECQNIGKNDFTNLQPPSKAPNKNITTTDKIHRKLKRYAKDKSPEKKPLINIQAV